MASTSLPSSTAVFSPSFKEDVQTGLSANAETGVWFVFGAGIVMSVLIIVLSGLALAQNTNFPSDNLDSAIVWTAIGSIAAAAIALLVTPWLVFQSIIIATINFILFFLVLGLVVIALLAIAQTQQTDATESFETAIFWISIVWIVVALLGAVGLGVLLWDLNQKQNPVIQEQPLETTVETKTIETKKTTTNADQQLDTQSVVVSSTTSTISPMMQQSEEMNMTGDVTGDMTTSPDIITLTQEELDSLQSPGSASPITKNGITILSDVASSPL